MRDKKHKKNDGENLIFSPSLKPQEFGKLQDFNHSAWFSFCFFLLGNGYR
jgi:hypothetical protein